MSDKYTTPVRGKNSSKKTKNGRQARFLCVPLQRNHHVMPGAPLFCAPCGQQRENGDIYQHFAGCDCTQYYLTLQEKSREPFLYLEQRNFENPTTWQHPGTFVMFKPQHTRAMMKLFSPEMLAIQDPNWNVLKKIKVVEKDLNGDPHYDGYFFEYLEKLAKQMKIKENKDQEIFVTTFSDEEGEGEHLNVRWNLKHEPSTSKLEWSGAEQRQMEQGRHMAVKFMKKHNFETMGVSTMEGGPTKAASTAHPVDGKCGVWQKHNKPFLKTTPKGDISAEFKDREKRAVEEKRSADKKAAAAAKAAAELAKAAAELDKEAEFADGSASKKRKNSTGEEKEEEQEEDKEGERSSKYAKTGTNNDGSGSPTGSETSGS